MNYKIKQLNYSYKLEEYKKKMFYDRQELVRLAVWRKNAIDKEEYDKICSHMRMIVSTYGELDFQVLEWLDFDFLERNIRMYLDFYKNLRDKGNG